MKTKSLTTRKTPTKTVPAPTLSSCSAGAVGCSHCLADLLIYNSSVRPNQETLEKKQHCKASGRYVQKKITDPC